MMPPAPAIEKNRIQGMVRSIDQYRNCDPKAIADGSYAQILYALTDDKNDILVLWGFAVSTALQLEALQRENAELREALKPFARHKTADGLRGPDSLLYIPDDHPLLFNGLGNDARATVTVGDIRRAAAIRNMGGEGDA